MYSLSHILTFYQTTLGHYLNHHMLYIFSPKAFQSTFTIIKSIRKEYAKHKRDINFTTNWNEHRQNHKHSIEIDEKVIFNRNMGILIQHDNILEPQQHHSQKKEMYKQQNIDIGIFTNSWSAFRQYIYDIFKENDNKHHYIETQIYHWKSKAKHIHAYKCMYAVIYIGNARLIINCN